MRNWLDGWMRTLRFGRVWVGGRAGVKGVELSVDRGDDRVPATLYLPERRSRRLPGWVVLHGMTRPGRVHPSLVRFARALASTQAAVLIPEIPEWRDLRLDPERAVPTIQAAVLALDGRPETEPGRTGLLGFSFGSAQAIVASTDPRLEGHLAAVVGFGGYCDMARTIRFQFSGRHEWNGLEHSVVPDPYGRWIVGANYLTAVPGHEDAGPVARALHALAAQAGDRGLPAGDPAYEPLKARLRADLQGRHRPLFDLFAAPGSAVSASDEAEQLAEGLAQAANRITPAIDPLPYLPRVRVPVRLIHGRQDELIPYTESLRLASVFPRSTDVSAVVTDLFAHSREPSRRVGLGLARETGVFLNGFRRAIDPV